MQIKQIKPGCWYQTKQGIGLCLAAGGTRPPSVKFNIVKPLPRGTVYLAPREVQYEIPEGDEPAAAPAQADDDYITGTLSKNSNGRWQIDYTWDDGVAGTHELSSGSAVELAIAGMWIKTSIEHNGKHYYPTTPGISLSAGMLARVKG